ncbi:MAG: replication factor C large subunit [Candidatus Heimdallarchaeota archaeon]|nr:replication factor C large subunit [Candidatus Heimdallarchaeota archaeon]MCK4610518.1 replication factor C large subunit [Candidatus Heimdallarchaeota archaeon]
MTLMASKKDNPVVPWVEKYRPERLEDFVGNKEAIQKLENWLKSWNQQRKKVVLLAGPAGVGKTSVVYYLIKKYDYEFVEVNASDKRNKKAVELLVGKSSTEGTVLQGARVRKLILVDEADGLFGNEDRGGGSALTKAVTMTRTPIICTANDPSASSLKSAKKNMLVIEFHSLKEEEILTLLKKIVKEEKLDINEETLIAITKNSGGDARSAINDLEGASFGIKDVKIIFNPRNQKYSLDSALNNIFGAKDFASAKRALDGVDVDYRELLTYVYEHAYKQADSSEELFSIYQLIAEADIYLQRCYIKQDWKFLKYFFTFISSVGLVKTSSFKYAKYGFPSYWSLMGRLRGKNASLTGIANKSIKKLHCSKKAFQVDYYPFIRVIFNTNPRMAAGLVAWFRYDESDILFLTDKSNKLTRRILEYSEEAYLQMAEEWINKAKQMNQSLIFYTQKTTKSVQKSTQKQKKTTKTETTGKAVKENSTKTENKEEKSNISQDELKKKKADDSETKEKEEKKPTDNKNKKGSQTSLETFLGK